MARPGKGARIYRTGFSREDMPQRPQGFTLAWPEGCGTLRRKAAETKKKAAAPGASRDRTFSGSN